MEVGELRPGLWRWELPHPEWTPEEAAEGGWEEIVASHALYANGDFVLVDPLAPPPGTGDAERFWRALDRDVQRHGPPAVLLTLFWHARSAQQILDRYEGTTVWAHEPARELVEERTRVTHTFRPGEALPGGAVAYDAGRAFEVLLWFPSHAALAVGDVLLGAQDGARLLPQSWVRGKTHDDLRRTLRPVLELPLELLLLAHGDAIVDDARGSLRRALA